jgi:integrase
MSRRRRPLGYLRQLDSNRWYVQVDLGPDADGKRRKKTRRVTGTKTDANNALLELLSAGPMGKASPSLTLEEYLLRTWLPSKTRIQETTREGYLLKIKGQILPTLGAIPLNQLNPLLLQKWIADLEETVSKQTCLHAFGVLSNALNQAVKWDLILKNPLVAVDPPRADEPEILRPTLEECLQIIQLFRGHSIEPAVALALGAGLRRSEVCACKWEDIDFEAGTVSVTKKRVRLRGKNIISHPKSARSRRKLTMATWAIDVLRAVRVRQLRDRVAAGPLWFDTDHVVIGKRGNPLAPNTVTHAFQDVRKKTAMREITYHGLRHGFATMSVLAKTDLPTLSARMGHSNTKITQRYYEIVSEADREAAAKLDALFLRDVESGGSET